MKLSTFKIENHSRLADCTIEVRKHLVIVGPNDVGKSSLLRCLDLLLGASTAALYGRIDATDFRDKSLPFVVEATLTDLKPDDYALFPDEIHVNPVTGERHLRVQMTASLDSEETLSAMRTAPDGSTGRQMSRDQLAGLGWKTVGAAHSSSRDFRDDRNTSLDDIISAIELGDEEAQFASIAAAFQGQLDGSAVLRKLRSRLSNQLKKALPEGIEQDDLSFVSTATEDLLSDVRLQIRRKGELRNMTEQSDGARALFAIALYDLVAESANIVAIDEPEIHLHPSSQRSLGRLLRDGANQKILATHSPDIVGIFDVDDVVVVKPGGVVVQPSAGFLDDEERLLAHWWVANKLEPLTSRRVALVEGPADRIIIQRAAELTDRDLDRLGVALVELGGAGDVKYVHKLFGSSGFNVAMSVLIDRDAVSDTETHLGLTESEFASNSVFVSEADLEDEYTSALGHTELFAALESSKLFTKNELRNCTRSGTGKTLLPSDVAAFCRFKSSYKVRAALVAASIMDAASARKVGSVDALLSDVMERTEW
ncbi:ATP-dependent nuclease [Pseudarthrobacter sp. S3]|uniref:ATP-dependent nuclease n=1 Tax=Pseudarthrobacter sp. S3 TaxID=3418419 RepID=UPI003CF119C5